MVESSNSLQFAQPRFLAVLLPRNRQNNFGLGSSAFARHYSRNHSCFLFLQVLRCFSSLRSPLFAEMSGLQPDGLPHSDICGSTLLTTPHSFSQFSTSFFASKSLGIPHTPLQRFSELLRLVIVDCCTTCQRTPCPSWAVLPFTEILNPHYKPNPKVHKNKTSQIHSTPLCVENNGFEPLTPCVQGRCSSQLS